jgi:hypothetical protein
MSESYRKNRDIHMSAIAESRYSACAENDEEEQKRLDDVPVRWLDNFTFYSIRDERVIQLVEGVELDHYMIQGVGLVGPAYDEEDDNDSNEEITDGECDRNIKWTTVRLSPIKKLVVAYDNLEEYELMKMQLYKPLIDLSVQFGC